MFVISVSGLLDKNATIGVSMLVCLLADEYNYCALKRGI